MTDGALELIYPLAGDYSPIFSMTMKFTVIASTFLGLGLFRILDGI